MLDLNKLFLDFHDEISLTKTYKEKITKGRDALRNKIGNKFEEKGRKTSTLYTGILCHENSYYALRWR